MIDITFKEKSSRFCTVFFTTRKNMTCHSKRFIFLFNNDWVWTFIFKALDKRVAKESTDLQMCMINSSMKKSADEKIMIYQDIFSLMYPYASDSWNDQKCILRWNLYWNKVINGAKLTMIENYCTFNNTWKV